MYNPFDGIDPSAGCRATRDTDQVITLPLDMKHVYLEIEAVATVAEVWRLSFSRTKRRVFQRFSFRRHEEGSCDWVGGYRCLP